MDPGRRLVRRLGLHKRTRLDLERALVSRSASLLSGYAYCIASSQAYVHILFVATKHKVYFRTTAQGGYPADVCCVHAPPIFEVDASVKASFSSATQAISW